MRPNRGQNIAKDRILHRVGSCFLNKIVSNYALRAGELFSADENIENSIFTNVSYVNECLEVVNKSVSLDTCVTYSMFHSKKSYFTETMCVAKMFGYQVSQKHHLHF